jgi:toxin ParE1/3/4
MRVFVSDAAHMDLLQAYSYLRERNPAAAESFANEINRKLGNLSRYPFIGRPRPSLRPGLRSILAGAHVIFYSVDEDTITIMRVLHGRRDIDKEFQR